MTGPRILFIDIETSPHKVWSFRIFKTVLYPENIIEPSRTICWSAKWQGEKRILYRSEYHDDGIAMLWEARELLDKCDVAVAYNGDRFDFLRLRQQFRLHGIPMPSPFVQVDLMKVVKKEGWPSVSMDYVTSQLGLARKINNGGMLTWRECLGEFGEERQRKAWNLMRRYSKHDIPPLEALFNEYAAEIQNIPAVGLYAEELPSLEIPDCPRCPDGGRPTRQGYKRTKTRRYARFQCQAEGCGRWFSQTRSEMGVNST